MSFSKMVLAAVMVMGSVAAVGCNAPAAATRAADDLAQAAQPSDSSSFFVRARESFGFRETARFGYRPAYVHENVRVGYGLGYSPVFVRVAPPAARYEVIGRAPSARHFWVNGYQSWNGREYVWVGGHWDVRRNGQTYVQPHYDVINGQYRFMPGHWA